MKKFLGILVLGLLWCNNTFSEIDSDYQTLIFDGCMYSSGKANKKYCQCTVDYFNKNFSKEEFEEMLNSNPEEVEKLTKNSINFCKGLIEGETGYAYE